MPKPDLHPTVDAFLDMLTAERGAAMNTRQAYWRDLADVSIYLRGEKSIELNEASTDQLKDYLEHLTNKIHTKGESVRMILQQQSKALNKAAHFQKH